MRRPVLVVDDEPMERELLAEAVQRAGASVVTAGDGEEALVRFRETRPPLILTDLRMPRMDGLELLRTVKRDAPETDVVLVTGYRTPALVEEVRRAGGSQVLGKPVTFAELRAVVRHTLERAGRTTGPAPVFLTRNPQTEAVLAVARRVAATDATVLIQGETGTGKEVLARLIHHASPRAGGPFVAVNCAALPETLIEAELFGHERGAFTGAVTRRAGRFETASGGTLFLDEISEIPLALQAKLLRALQEREIERVGSSAPIRVDVRVIAATNRDLRMEVAEGRFRKDLFYRVNVVCLRLPPLRDRAGDIGMLSQHFLEEYALAHGSPARGFTPEALERLITYPWPGNVRELENVIQRAVILCDGPAVGAEHLILEEIPGSLAAAPLRGPALPGAATHPAGAGGAARTLDAVERDLILATLERLGGNRTHTARALGLSVRTIRNRLRQYRQVS